MEGRQLSIHHKHSDHTSRQAGHSGTSSAVLENIWMGTIQLRSDPKHRSAPANRWNCTNSFFRLPALLYPHLHSLSLTIVTCQLPLMPGLFLLPLLLEMLITIQQPLTHTCSYGQTDRRGRIHTKNRRVLVLHRVLLRGMKKVLYVARTPIQLWLQPVTAYPNLVPLGLLVSTGTGGRGSIPQSSGTSAVLSAAGIDGIDLGAEDRIQLGAEQLLGQENGEVEWAQSILVGHCLWWKGRGECCSQGCLQTKVLGFSQVSFQLCQGHGEIGSINGLIENKATKTTKHLSSHQLSTKKGPGAAAQPPLLCFADQDEQVLVHLWDARWTTVPHYPPSTPPGFRQISLITAVCLVLPNILPASGRKCSQARSPPCMQIQSSLDSNLFQPSLHTQKWNWYQLLLPWRLGRLLTPTGQAEASYLWEEEHKGSAALGYTRDGRMEER